jgi:putative ABC transport system substrate-binding protein
MRRREFITFVGGAAAVWPPGARAQQPKLPIVGLVSSTGLPRALVDSFRRALSDAGYVEGQNVAIAYVSAEGRNERLADLVAGLVRRQVAVIATFGIPAAKAAQAATTTIPIVFEMGGDPVDFGLVASLNRPGGNITGTSTLSVELTPKRIDLLHELVPTATATGVLVDPTNPNAETLERAAQAAAAALGLQVRVVRASSEREIEAAFAALDQAGARALVITNTGLFNAHADRLGSLALRHLVPAIFQYREFATAGGLLSYGDNSNEQFRVQYRQAAVYVGRILNGEKPADLPVQLFTRTGLIINLKTAKALGITVPITLSGRADEVIE